MGGGGGYKFFLEYVVQHLVCVVSSFILPSIQHTQIDLKLLFAEVVLIASPNKFDQRNFYFTPDHVGDPCAISTLKNTFFQR